MTRSGWRVSAISRGSRSWLSTPGSRVGSVPARRPLTDGYGQARGAVGTPARPRVAYAGGRLVGRPHGRDRARLPRPLAGGLGVHGRDSGSDDDEPGPRHLRALLAAGAGP